MSVTGHYLEHGMALHGASSDPVEWHRRAAGWAVAVALGITGPGVVWTIGHDDPRRDAGTDRRLGRTLQDAIEDLDRRRTNLEWNVWKLIDAGLDARDTPDVIEGRITALVATQPQDIQTVVEFCPWEALIRDRVAAWRWRTSPRGRRALGQC